MKKKYIILFLCCLYFFVFYVLSMFRLLFRFPSFGAKISLFSEITIWIVKHPVELTDMFILQLIINYLFWCFVFCFCIKKIYFILKKIF